MALRRLNQSRPDSSPRKGRVDRDIGYVKHTIHRVHENETDSTAIFFCNDDISLDKPT